MLHEFVERKQQLSVTVCLKQDITVVLLCRCCRVSQYRFCQIMAENLPRLREDIKEISMSDLKDFLESIRKHSDKVGETAMRQVRGGSPLRKELSRFASTQPLFDFFFFTCMSIGTAAQNLQQCGGQTGQHGPLHQARVLPERTDTSPQQPDDRRRHRRRRGRR